MHEVYGALQEAGVADNKRAIEEALGTIPWVRSSPSRKRYLAEAAAEGLRKKM